MTGLESAWPGSGDRLQAGQTGQLQTVLTVPVDLCSMHDRARANLVSSFGVGSSSFGVSSSSFGVSSSSFGVSCSSFGVSCSSLTSS